MSKKLNEFLDLRGPEYKMVMERTCDNKWPQILNAVATETGLTQDINDAEREGTPIIRLLNMFYKMGFYAGVEFALDDHTDIERTM